MTLEKRHRACGWCARQQS